jgi:hypothetical protein
MISAGLSHSLLTPNYFKEESDKFFFRFCFLNCIADVESVIKGFLQNLFSDLEWLARLSWRYCLVVFIAICLTILAITGTVWRRMSIDWKIVNWKGRGRYLSLPYLWHYPDIYMERWRLTARRLRVVVVTTKVRDEYPQNTSQERYHLGHHARWVVCGGRGYVTGRSPSLEHCIMPLNVVKNPERLDVWGHVD